MNVLLVLFFVLGEYQNVIQIDDNKVVKVLPKDVIHHMLENSRSIGKAKRHDIILKMAIPCTESCLPFVSFLDSYEVVSSPQINFREDLCTSKLLQKSRNQG